MRSNPESLLKQLDAHRASLLNAQRTQVTAEGAKKAAEDAAAKAAESATAADEAYDAASSSGVLLMDAIREYSGGKEPDGPGVEPPITAPPPPVVTPFATRGSPGTSRR